MLENSTPAFAVRRMMTPRLSSASRFYRLTRMHRDPHSGAVIQGTGLNRILSDQCRSVAIVATSTASTGNIEQEYQNALDHLCDTSHPLGSWHGDVNDPRRLYSPASAHCRRGGSDQSHSGPSPHLVIRQTSNMDKVNVMRNKVLT